MLVWRIENEYGDGPYQAIIGPWQDHVNDNRCPAPETDKGFKDSAWWQLSKEQRADWKFGFTSLYQLRKWFNDQELINLDIYCFRVAVYEADQIIATDYQCAFLPLDECPDYEIEIEKILDMSRIKWLMKRWYSSKRLARYA